MRIAVVNHKGGVGKTTTTVNLANALGNKAVKVLVIDQDPQCNTTATLMPGGGNYNTLYDLYRQAEGVYVRDCIYLTTYENVSILPNSPNSSSLEIGMYQNIPDSYLREHRTSKELDQTKRS